MAKPPRVSCPQCGKSLATTAAVGAHLRAQHGIYGGLSGRTRGDNAGRPTLAMREAEKPTAELVAAPGRGARNGSTRFKVTAFLVLQDQDGNMWLAEPIGEHSWPS